MTCVLLYYLFGITITLYVVDEGLVALVRKKLDVSDRMFLCGMVIAIVTMSWVSPIWLFYPRKRL